MYREFYQLKEHPFRLSPDNRYFIFSPQARGVYDQLLYGLEQGVGIMMLTGEVGVGKTSLVRYLMQNLDSNFETSFIFNPSLRSDEELLKFILTELLNKENPKNPFTFSPLIRKAELLDNLHRFLLIRYQKGVKVLLIIDESQCLSDALLEEIRLLSNFEVNGAKLIQLLLVGQPEFKKRIATSTWRALRQRIAIKAELQPLQKEEVNFYIRYRLTVAGANQEIFNASAIKKIYQASKGIPRLINLIAERSLIAGYISSKMQISKKEVNLALKDLDLY